MELHVISNTWMKWKVCLRKIYGSIYLLSIPKPKSVSITPLRSPKLSWSESSRHHLMKECLWRISSEEAA